ncbi:zinc knuckle-domain-containing protein [Lasiosphaeris hirsuta]|uniref:Zinc knuckle-domain-containing protein n=1 Tax=Lasiosphaeris hirsuta TaxID=260670 RepID=A0AA40APQ3_9PEZI|nr:zinc knuckle-domain-containing protein [Lasiosphaeris hirsuta]
MFSARGRSGPSTGTPATVQCQKCLKRGHYSYECKAAPQERPYVPRPSRTQQLRNPKLLPKLTNEVPDVLQRKKGVADEELAKKEAERARKRELEKEDSPTPRDSPPKRRRSYSSDSVSTISTRSPSPVTRRASRSPLRASRDPRDSRDVSPRPFVGRKRSVNSDDRYSSRASRSPERHLSTGISPVRRRSPSPHPGRPAAYYSRDHGKVSPPRRGYSRSISRSRSPVRSPARSTVRRDGRREQLKTGRYRDRNDHIPRDTGAPPRPPQRQPSPPRERSLSPFSKRLALTQAMNMGR